jgi:hypothetical protein
MEDPKSEKFKDSLINRADFHRSGIWQANSMRTLIRMPWVLFSVWLVTLPWNNGLDGVVEGGYDGVQDLALDELLLGVHEELLQPCALLLVPAPIRTGFSQFQTTTLK